MSSLGNNPTSKSPPAAHQNRSGSLWIHPSWLWIHPSWLLFHPSWLRFHPSWSCQANLDPLPLPFLSPPPATCLSHFSTYNHQRHYHWYLRHHLQCIAMRHHFLADWNLNFPFCLESDQLISPGLDDQPLLSPSCLQDNTLWDTHCTGEYPAFKIACYETYT